MFRCFQLHEIDYEEWIAIAGFQLKILSMKMMMLNESQIRYQQRQAVEVVYSLNQYERVENLTPKEEKTILEANNTPRRNDS